MHVVNLHCENYVAGYTIIQIIVVFVIISIFIVVFAYQSLSMPAAASVDIRKRFSSPDYPLIVNVQIVSDNTLQADYNPRAGLRN